MFMPLFPFTFTCRICRSTKVTVIRSGKVRCPNINCQTTYSKEFVEDHITVHKRTLRWMEEARIRQSMNKSPDTGNTNMDQGSSLGNINMDRSSSSGSPRSSSIDMSPRSSSIGKSDMDKGSSCGYLGGGCTIL